MYQAIEVKYFPPTTHRAERYVAFCQAKRKSFPAAINLDGAGNTWLAAKSLAKQLGWSGVYFGGRLKNGNAVFVQACLFEYSRFEIDKSR